MIRTYIQSERGMATVEFAALLSMILLMVFVIVDFGGLIQAQAVVTNISREGGSLASRDLKNGPDLINLLEASSSPLDFQANPSRYKIYIAKVNAGVDSNNPDPTCTVQEGGQLTGVSLYSPAASPTCDLTQSLYDLLKFDDTIQASPISQLTVVKVFYVHQPITPMESVFKASGNSVMNFNFSGQGTDNDSILLSSKSIF